jgi:hypothetical protein
LEVPPSIRAEIAELEQAVGRADGEPMLVLVYGDPERRSPGPNMATIAGETLMCGEDEDRDAFRERVRIAAIAAGLAVAIISAESYDDFPYLDDLVGDDDPTKVIEIGGRA